jgi:uncharacterized membrane protein
MAGFSESGLSGVLSSEKLSQFLSPKEYGYEIWNTLAYAVLLVAAAYVVFKILKRMNINVDERLAVAVSPFVVLGSCLRVIKDAGIVDSYLFVTPGIYVFVFSVFFAVVFAAMVLQKKFKIEYYKTVFFLGLMTLPFALAQLDYFNLWGGATIVVLLVPWVVLFSFAKWSATNKIVTLMHLFDATTTFVAMSFFGYYEQHIVPTFFINLFTPVSFVFLKLVAVVGVLYLIDRLATEEEDKEFAPYLKLVIGILGAATGTRDFITLLAGI